MEIYEIKGKRTVKYVEFFHESHLTFYVKKWFFVPHQNNTTNMCRIWIPEMSFRIYLMYS